jgi:hypothetical protein
VFSRKILQSATRLRSFSSIAANSCGFTIYLRIRYNTGFARNLLKLLASTGFFKVNVSVSAMLARRCDAFAASCYRGLLGVSVADAVNQPPYCRKLRKGRSGALCERAERLSLAKVGVTTEVTTLACYEAVSSWSFVVGQRSQRLVARSRRGPLWPAQGHYSEGR